jgi:phosphohistidine phosphatase
MKLYLLRHGEAVAELVDPKRPLSDAGKAETRKVAHFLKRARINIMTIIHSDKKRTQETAEIVQEILNPQAQLVEKNYLGPNDPTEKIVEDISRAPGDLMIVGHLPFLDHLISHLILKNEKEIVLSLKTSSVVCLEKDKEHNWQVIWLISPDLIPLQEDHL